MAYGRPTSDSLRLLLPFEEEEVTTKIITLLKSFNNRSEEMNM